MFCLASAFRSWICLRIRLVQRQFSGIISTNETVRKPVNCVAFHRLNYDSFGTWKARNFLAKRYQLHVNIFFPHASRSSSAIAHTYFLHRLPFSTHRSTALPTWRLVSQVPINRLHILAHCGSFWHILSASNLKTIIDNLLEMIKVVPLVTNWSIDFV